MIFISLKKFMLIDLFVIALVGVFAEAFSMGIFFRKNHLTPTFIFSIAITFLGCTRWGIKGLVLAPIMSITAWITGKCLIDTNGQFKELFYGWQTLLATMAGNLSVGFVCIIYKRKNYEELCPSVTSLLGLVVLVLFWTMLVQVIVICICGQAHFALKMASSNLVGVVVTLIVVAGMKSVGILQNVKQRLIANHKQAQEDAEYEREYLRRVNDNTSRDKEL